MQSPASEPVALGLLLSEEAPPQPSVSARDFLRELLREPAPEASGGRTLELPGWSFGDECAATSAAPPVVGWTSFSDERALRLPAAPTPMTQAAGGARLDGLRWLDPACAASGCLRCTAAPPVTSEKDFQLVGGAGKKNGEKVLRRLLTATREWSSTEERHRMAVDCDARGSAYASLALVLRGRANCSTLRKPHMLHMARAWGYASHVWLSRTDAALLSKSRGEQAGADAAALALPAAFPLADTSLPMLPGASHDALLEHIRAVLAPLVLESTRWYGGERALAAAQLAAPPQRRHLNASQTMELQLSIGGLRSQSVLLARLHRAAKADASRAGSGSATPAEPAWRLLMCAELPSENLARVMVGCFVANSTSTLDRCSGAAGALLSAEEMAWMKEFHHAQLGSLEFYTRVAAVQHELRLSSLSDMLKGTASLLKVMRTFTDEAITRFVSRAEWVTRLTPPSGSCGTDGADAPLLRVPLPRATGRAADAHAPRGGRRRH